LAHCGSLFPVPKYHLKEIYSISKFMLDFLFAGYSIAYRHGSRLIISVEVSDIFPFYIRASVM